MENPQLTEGGLLNQYYELCYRAFSGISFSPEKRAVSTINEANVELSADLELVPVESKDWYKEKYIQHFTGWMSAKSRCLSTMITGPANFNTRRNDKANQSEHNKLTAFIEWREHALNRFKRASKPKVIIKGCRPTEDVSFEGGVVRLNYEIDRIQLLFDEKPDSETIARLKKAAFKWSPKNTAWQRQLTDNARRATKYLLGNLLTQSI